MVARILPYWDNAIAPDLQAGRTVLVTAHGNSLRALCKELDDISDNDITELNIPTGTPIRYELGDNLKPGEAKAVLERSLDPEAARDAAETVARQAG